MVVFNGAMHFSIEANCTAGIPEMQQATSDLKRSFFSAIDTSLVLAGIFGIFGAIRVYHNWQMGRHHVDIEVAAWFFSSFFVVLLGAFLTALFGL